MFWPLQSSSEFPRVLEDSKSPLLGVWVSSSHLAQSGVATKEHIHAIVNQVNNHKIWHHEVRIEIIGWWVRMPIMRHGKIATKIFNLDLNLRRNGWESHVAVTTIIITMFVVIVIKDYGRRNMLIRGMMPNELFHEIWHHVALTNGGIQMHLLLH